jgi:hypothetical protein
VSISECSAFLSGSATPDSDHASRQGIVKAPQPDRAVITDLLGYSHKFLTQVSVWLIVWEKALRQLTTLDTPILGDCVLQFDVFSF